MAETKNSLALPSFVLIGAVLIGGFCLGVLGMSALIAPEFLWPVPHQSSDYELRENLDHLRPSPRADASLTETARELNIRESDPLTVDEILRPVRLVIASIDVDAMVEAVGLEPDVSGDGSEPTTVAVPGRAEAGWYKYGSSPGEPGATVLAGHVDLGGQQGVFWDLTGLQSGALIEIYLSDGSVAQYRVIRGTDFSRDSLPSDELFRQIGAPALHLITCGGAFNRNLGRYESNYVVTAAPLYTNA